MTHGTTIAERLTCSCCGGILSDGLSESGSSCGVGVGWGVDAGEGDCRDIEGGTARADGERAGEGTAAGER